MIGALARRFRHEDGFAMVTAMLLAMVVVFLGITIIGISLHNSSGSTYDRKRVVAIHTAEAGVNAYLSSLRTSTGMNTCSDMSADLPIVSGHYDVHIQLYSSWPPDVLNEMTCTNPLPAAPAGALVTSKGRSGAATSPAAVTRTMQSLVRFSPVYAGLQQAVFSNSQLIVQNNLTINGNVANDGDVYTNGSYTESNNTTISGSVYAQGNVVISQGVVKGDIWANGSVELHNLTAFGRVSSSTSTITIDNTHVYQDMRAGTSITLSSNSVADGLQITNSPQGAPPAFPFPRIPYNPAKWPSPTWATDTFSTCASAKAFIEGLTTAGNHVVRITSVCDLQWGNNANVNLYGNLAIITDGSVTTQNQVNFNGVNGNWLVYILRPWDATLPCTPPTPSPYDISISNKTSFNSLHLLVYTPCSVFFGNNNADGVYGQLIGGTVTITNQMVLNYRPIEIPDSTLTGYNVDITYLREVTNS
jgi:cytoskeletal protein CcmA (bactofilin family)